MAAYEILDCLRVHGIHAPATIYRALNSLIKSGHIRKIETNSRYIAISKHNTNDIAIVPFVICSTCGKITKVDGAGFVVPIHSVCAGHLKQLDAVSIEISGECCSCSESR